jgi:DNA polymerase-3 subunit gamma/tau
LSVLAQAGEGSVRDSLSALDQAIACCGTKLEADEVRTLLGMFALESLDQVALGILDQDSHKMLEIVAELEANGRSLQHFARELARYFRNLLVIRIEKGPTRLVGASAPEQEKMAVLAAKFREEDLTRDLKLSLDLFKDLQESLQPRLHLEMGLLRLVQAGRLLPIEEALASLGGGAGPSPSPTPSAPPVSRPPVRTAPSAASPPPPAPSTPVPGDLRSNLLAALAETKQTHLSDAVEHCDVQESANEVVFTTPKMYQLYLKSPELDATVKRLLGRPVRITIRVGEVKARETSGTAGAPPVQGEAAARALAHPEVQRFQELFPDSQVRAVRDLRETES